MPSIGDKFVREAVTQGWNVMINNATGQPPIIQRGENENTIYWRPGQAKEMATYLSNAMSGESSIGVNIDLMPVLTRLAWKKGWPFLLGIPLFIFLAGKYT